MTDEATTNGEDGDAVDGTDNAVIRELRAQLKEAKSALKANDPDVVRKQVLAEVKRETTAASLMEKAGFPKLSKLFVTEVDGDPTPEKAEAFLESLGLTTEEAKESSPANDVADVARLGQTLAGTVSGQTTIDQRISSAGEGKTYREALAELEGLARDGGFYQQS